MIFLNFFNDFFEKFPKFYVGMNWKDSRNDFGELSIGVKGFKANVLPTDGLTNQPTDGPIRWRIELLHATKNGEEMLFERKNFSKKFFQKIFSKFFFSKKCPLV